MPETVITLPDAVQLMANALTAILVAGFGSAPITLLLVSIFKRFLPQVEGGIIQFVTAIVLTLLFWLAQYFGYEQQFRSVVEALLVIAPAVIALLTTLLGSSQLYKSAKKADLPVVGYARS